MDPKLAGAEKRTLLPFQLLLLDGAAAVLELL